MEQLNSLTNQISALTRMVSTVDQWRLIDVYIDIASAKSKSPRKDFVRMIDDCKKNKIDIVITKSLSRFGRDTIDTLEALKELGEANVRVIFEQEDLDTANTESALMISIVEGIAQAENESRSENIRWGIKERAAKGTSKLYDRKCYGYDHDEKGKLVINSEEAKVVEKIFEWYLNGKSILGILKELEIQGIKSPMGKDKWCKRTIDVVLSNEKYIGNVRLLDSVTGGVEYLVKENNPPIISANVFNRVKAEKKKRSNVIKNEEETIRKEKKYSSKK
ncbi:recombinase family protein [Clostridium algidicarnis]